MTESSYQSLGIAIAGLAIAAGFSVPAVIQSAKRLGGKKYQEQPTSDYYEDKDGKATEDSESTFSDLIPRIVLLVGAVVGCADSLISAILMTTRPSASLCVEQWLQFATWALILFQAVILFTCPTSVTRFNLGVYGGIASFFFALAIAFENIVLWLSSSSPLPRNIHLTLSLIQFIASIIVLFANLSIPRRPAIYHKGKVVDGMNTVPIVSRIGFTWVESFLNFAAKNRGLGFDDVPAIPHFTRADTLVKDFEAVGKRSNLWITLFLIHKTGILLQWGLQVVISFTNFLPQALLYIVLKTLEARDAGEDVTLRLWLLVIGLSFADAISALIENWMFYITLLKVGNPLYMQLAAVIFGKATRRKDVKGATKLDEDDSKKSDAAATSENKKEGDGDEADLQKTKQSTINLIGVDTIRMSMFTQFNYILWSSFVKLAIAVAFLIRLIGIVPLLAGFAAPVVILPLNYFVTKRYSRAQDVLMKQRDSKMAIITEALQGIRQIKFSALEKNWHDRILKYRQKELEAQWTVFLADSVLISIWIFGPVMLSAVSLATYAAINKELSASVAFTTITLFEAIEMTLAVMPEMITSLLDAMVSAKRIQKYLDSPEREPITVEDKTVSFCAATIAWPSDESEKSDDDFKLRDVNITFPREELSVISGRTGSGKSLLLSTIIGESDVLSGTVKIPQPPPVNERYDSEANPGNWLIPSAVAYVAQVPWIENASLKDNILFDLPMNESRYKKILQVCALEKDLEMMEDGDMTDIGANGINLSGGQKARISFARALYSRAGILVMDDIFSAVDAHVGRQLYEQALTGELGKGRTRILVTHHVALCLPQTTYSVLLDNGAVIEAGYTNELRKSGKLKKILAYDVEEQAKEEDETVIVDDGGGSLAKILTNQSRTSRRRSTMDATTNDLARKISHASVTPKPAAPRKFVEEEQREIGAVKLNIYGAYIRACGGFSYWTFIGIVFSMWIVAYLARSYWVTIWTRSYETESSPNIFSFPAISTQTWYSTQINAKANTAENSVWFYLSIYVGICVGAWLIGTVRYFFVFVASIRASKTLFESLTYAVIRAPLRWLDTVPLGRILNRFTADFNKIDSNMAYDLGFGLHSAVSVIAVLIAGMFVSPFMLIFAVLLLAACARFAYQYLSGAREIKRLESLAKSPVFEQFSSVLTGISTIRAYGKADEYINRMHSKIDRHCAQQWHMVIFNRWVQFRMTTTGAVFVGLTAALIVSIRRIDASLAGFALSFGLNLSDSAIWMIRQYANVELNMNSTERIVEYSEIKIEDQEGKDAPAAWPTEGRIEVEDLVVGYAPELQPVLKGLTFKVKPNERIGVVGRTGAGKSSLTLALFRFLEPRSGSITIDGVDVSTIKLYDLRSRLAIIPQDPVLFSGTVRSNLDSFDQHTDIELREALARVHLISPPSSTRQSGSATPVRPSTSSGEDDANEVIQTEESNINIFKSLSSKISEGGLNLSQGQRQLLCLARAIVSRPKIMVLDEATSAVDMQTDALIQRSIREEFLGSTLIVIAHRLSTIADFDRILVMGEGRVLEFDTPKNLMENKNSEFRKMVQESGERAELEEIIQGKDQQT